MAVDLLPQDNKIEKSKKSLFFFGRIFVILVIGFAVAASVFSYQVVTSEPADGNSFMARVSQLPIFSGLRFLTGAGDNNLKGQKEDRINFLLLGVGGAGHDGPDLTDTIILTSLRPSDGKVAMLSIPRDMSVNIPGYSWRKINNANAFGEWQETGYGPILASKVVSDITGQPIHYYVRVDFSGFEEFIDEIGGLDVYVDRNFTDYAYPAPEDKYQVVSFEQGWQKMDGDTALKYVRSRHGTNGEGSDFARSRRQQKVLMAVKEKILTPSVLLNPGKIVKLYETVKDHVATNLNSREILQFVKMSRSVDLENIISKVLDTGPNSPLYATSIDGAYLILPRGGTWNEVRNIAASIFEQPAASQPTQVASAATGTEKIKVEIQNGTTVPGLAYSTSLLLKENKFDVVKIGNAMKRDYEKSIIFDLTNGEKSEELTLLRSLLDAEVSVSASGWIFTPSLIPTEITLSDEDSKIKATVDNINFLVILGQTSQNTVQ